MARRYGCLVREGKVRCQTPRVAKTSDTSYHGGRAKYKQQSSNNLEYSTGAHRLEEYYSTELKQYDQQYKKENQRCDWIAERANVKRAEPVLLNSYHKFNTEKGNNKVEWNLIRQEEKAAKNRITKAKNQASNHKKWHRNHPKDGIYQKRTIGADDLECEEDQVVAFSHMCEEQ